MHKTQKQEKHKHSHRSTKHIITADFFKVLTSASGSFEVWTQAPCNIVVACIRFVTRMLNFGFRVQFHIVFLLQVITAV